MVASGSGPRIYVRRGASVDRTGNQSPDEGGSMSIKGKAYIVGAFEHPDRVIPDRSVAQIHAENTAGVLADAGLKLSDIDGLFVVGGGGMLPISTADYLGLTNLKFVDGTAVGGSSPVYHIGHAAAAIAEGKCSVALVTLANRPRSEAAVRSVS